MKKRFLSLLLALTLVCSLFVPAMAAEGAAAPAGDKIVILHTNDVHCGVDQTKDKKTEALTGMGYAAVAALKKEAQTQYGAENVTLLDAGDAIQGGPIGTLSKGSYIVDIMNEVGYDLAVPGNHEFDYGMDNFLALTKTAKYTYLCSNFTDLAGKPVLDAYKMMTYGDTKVAYVGIDTPEAFTKSNPTYFQNAKGEYIYTLCEGGEGKDLYTNVQKSVDAAKKEGANYVVAVGHLGVDTQSSPWMSTELVKNTNGIDLFIDGHSHSTFGNTAPNKDGKDVPMAQTGTKLENVGKIIIDKKTGAITTELVTAYATQDPAAAKFIGDINAKFETVLKEVVAKTSVALTTKTPAGDKRAVRSAETNLGDLCADAYRLMLGADVAFVNGGGVRADIKAGDITYEDIINVHPFGNEACMVEATGQQILDALEMGVRSLPDENGGFLQVSGITFDVDTSIKSGVKLSDKKEFLSVEGDRRVSNVKVGDAALDPAKTYTLASHNYMLKSGGDGFTMFMKNKILKDCVMIDNQVLINYIVEKLGGVVGEEYAKPQGQGRINIKYLGVESGTWYTDAAKYVLDYGIMTGTGNGFTPAGTVTRGTVFQTLYNMAGAPPVTEKATYTDIPEGAWYANAAAWAEDAKLATGTGETLFNGEKEATRGEIATILYRFAPIMDKMAVADDDTIKEMVDFATLPDWAVEGITGCYSAKIIGGKEGKRLAPEDTATRAELAKMLQSFAEAPMTYVEEVVLIDVPATDGVPAHQIPAIITRPNAETEKSGAVVMLHGTGSDKNEAGGAYAAAAPYMAKCGVATIRIDFMGNGESKADYKNYSYTSANVDAKAAADYMAKQTYIDPAKIGVMGWSQGGTNALLAAAKYPETFKAVVTWAGATDLTGLFGADNFEKAYATAKKDGAFEMKFDWRTPLMVGEQWFKDVKNTNVLTQVGKIKAPILAVQGAKDTVVLPENAEKIVKAAKNNDSCAYSVTEADHTFQVFSGDYAVLNETVDATLGFFMQQFDGQQDAFVKEISKYGNVTTTLPISAAATAGFVPGDVLKVTVGKETLDLPYGTGYSNVETASEIAIRDEESGMVELAINMGNFAKVHNVAVGDPITITMGTKKGFLKEFELSNIDSKRTNVRADYKSDEVFANFRMIKMGKLPGGVLYRSSSPANNELGRAATADAQCKAAGIAAVINLADSKEDLEGYFAAEGFASPYYKGLYDANKVCYLDMGVDFEAKEFAAKLKTGLEFMIANKGPYVIHCTEGKDRAGFVSALLGALMGGTRQQITEDYMTSFTNYYHITKDSEQYKTLVTKNIEKTLRQIVGISPVESLLTANLQKGAETYLTETVGMTAEQVTALKTALSTPIAAQKAA
ncbi:MAG: alpha/beta fold hydrolase [Oscillospiraceae bacterium]